MCWMRLKPHRGPDSAKPRNCANVAPSRLRDRTGDCLTAVGLPGKAKAWFMVVHMACCEKLCIHRERRTDGSKDEDARATIKTPSELRSFCKQQATHVLFRNTYLLGSREQCLEPIGMVASGYSKFSSGGQTLLTTSKLWVSPRHWTEGKNLLKRA